MKARSILSPALLLAGLTALVPGGRSSAQDSATLVDGFQLGQPPGGVFIDDTAERREIVPVVPSPLLPDGTRFRNPVIGTLILEDENEPRAVTPAFQFDTARPLVIEYMELHGQLAERLTDAQLESEITALREALQVMDADDDLNEIRQSLQRLIERHPDTPAAGAARRALEQLDAAEEPENGFDPPSPSGALKPPSGNRPFSR